MALIHKNFKTFLYLKCCFLYILLKITQTHKMQYRVYESDHASAKIAES